MTNKPELFLYSRESCPPCLEFKRRLDSLRQRYNYDCYVLDVDSDPELRQRYGNRVPVLVADGVEICERQFDETALLRYLEARRQRA